MPKNIAVCCDGTGNEIGVNMSNVLKLYRALEKNDLQVAYYDPGVGTLGQTATWGRISQDAKGVLGLATGYGLDSDVLEAYRFLATHYAEGDSIYLFGFSRGAYSVRVLAGFIFLLGLLRPDQLNYVGYAFAAYKRAAMDHQDLSVAWHFRRIVGGRTVPIRFVGVWDTVASVIVPRPDRFYVPSLQALPYTLQNPGVETFRQAIAIDECRRMFRLQIWKEGQLFRPDRFSASDPPKQDARQVWFAGCHSDVGGGFSEEESGLSKFPLRWIIDEAVASGLKVRATMVDHLRPSATGAWRILEWLPKSARRREWPGRHSILGVYLPRCEPRLIPDGAQLHQSVLDRMALVKTYQPQNLPTRYEIVQ